MLLKFLTQGNEHSYHGQVAEIAAAGVPFDCKNIARFEDMFTQVMTSDGYSFGVFAIHNTTVGPIEKSTKVVMGRRELLYPWISQRHDIEVNLGLIAAKDTTEEDLRRLNQITVLGQSEGVNQVLPTLREILGPQVNVRFKKNTAMESTAAIQHVVGQEDDAVFAVGPTSAAEPMGAHVVAFQNGSLTSGNITSFYVGERYNHMTMLPAVDPDRTQPVDVLKFKFPSTRYSMQQMIEVARSCGLRVLRFTETADGTSTKDDPEVLRGGGILDVEVPERGSAARGRFAFEVINKFDGDAGSFSLREIGHYLWYPGSEEVTV